LKPRSARQNKSRSSALLDLDSHLHLDSHPLLHAIRKPEQTSEQTCL
jgi:hypothetical protein